MATPQPSDGEVRRPDVLAESGLERLCRILCEPALVALVLLTAAEVAVRRFDYSFEFVDEIGGYLLAALTFLSMPVALIGGAYHHVEYFQERLSPRSKAVSGLMFTSLSLAFTVVLEWQLWRLVSRSHASDVQAATLLGTPLWIPQSAMLAGAAALIVALIRILAAQWRAFRAVANRPTSDHG